MPKKNDKTNNADLPENETAEPGDGPVEEPIMKPVPHEQFAALAEELAELKETNLRILAESENFKRRLTREKEEHCKFAAASVLEDIVPVLDNLELALSHGRNNEACKDLVTGVEMTMNIFESTLEKHGLKSVGQVGERFDPAFHEAMGQEKRDDLSEGLVSQLLQRGYLLKDRLLRPAKVMISA
ncbi:MAG TPA: nucleotide exchange factor GrpE [Desulfomicrobiaceae bacterium]|jgi:molecular chaperone GrpE|nr:nucleotide exchange factor GrpE [Desulfomicrobiaceae bacterium]